MPESKLSILTIIIKVYFRNLELLGLQIFNSERRSLEFPMEKLELAHQYIGSVDNNLIGEKNGIFIKMLI